MCPCHPGRRPGIHNHQILDQSKLYLWVPLDPGSQPGMTKISHSKIFLTECHAQIGFKRDLIFYMCVKGFRGRVKESCFLLSLAHPTNFYKSPCRRAARPSGNVDNVSLNQTKNHVFLCFLSSGFATSKTSRIAFSS